jgi:MoaA/NifB/PqqE/SkfB family radical SAM enzyme
MKYLKRNINTVFLMLGNSCNMNCAYCLQHPLVHKPLTREVNPEIYDFLEEISQENYPAPPPAVLRRGASVVLWHHPGSGGCC